MNRALALVISTAVLRGSSLTSLLETDSFVIRYFGMN